jgi:Mg/Co/Ni transporter MgtE
LGKGDAQKAAQEVRTSMETVSRRLGRAAAFGLVGGLVCGAVVLLTLAVVRLQVDCTGLGPEECTFEEQLASSIARLQTLAAVGCAAVAAGGWLWLRRR